MPTPIKTKSVQLPPNVYFKIMLRNIFFKRKHIWIFILICAILQFLLDTDYKFPFLALIFLYFIFFFFFLWRYTRNKQNRAFYQNRVYIFDEKTFSVEAEDGSKSLFNWNNFLKAEKDKTFYLLIFSGQQFYYVPFEAFQKPEDQTQFEKILDEQKLLKQKNA